MPSPPRTIGIAGTGLIGTSIALAARRAWPDVGLSGFDRADVLRQPQVASVFSRLSPDLATLAECDLIVLALPVDAIARAVKVVASLAGAETLITDTGSTKRAIVGAAAGVPSFVGGHPMAGAERGGPDLARADLFDGCTWWVVPAADTATAAVCDFARAIGASPVQVDAARHDALMAAISHLPQVVASALMARVGEAAGEGGLAHAGAGLRDTTRLAASPAGMWASVLASNADEVAPLLRAVARDLDQIAEGLHDEGAVRRLFSDANRWRAPLDAERG
ncbi:MAG: prephenate dehydrogenase/arogenate dehydrogenase family protein [Vicinamibacterales bacterium]|nr:prephenate dehydrogenase/arogenate dehydrogenase family protein [Vicinamibacterales bacterium]